MRVEQTGKIKEDFIVCSNVTEEFSNADGNPFRVAEGLDFTVRENEFLVLFGPGQCGKTSILNMIAGFDLPVEGTIVVDGRPVQAPGPERGMVFQTTGLFPWLTVMGNVEYGPKVRGVNKKERREKAQRYIDLVGLQGFERSFPVKLSGGMKQRVGIARAYCNEPVVMLLDEPFGHLDAQTRYMMQEDLTKIWQKEKRTIIFVTNNIEEALYLADRILVLTNCPTKVKAEYMIDLPRPRDYTAPGFLKLRKEISEIVDHTR